MPLTASQLATQIDAQLRGDGSRALNACAGLEEAGPDAVSFLANARYAANLKTTRAGAVIVGARDVDNAPPTLTLLIARDPYFAFREAVIALHGYRQQPAPGISPQAVIDPSATIGEGCSVQPFAVISAGAKIGARTVIYPHCFIGPDTVIGDDCVLHSGVTIYESCTLGHRVIIHAGTAIGQDGFGYATHRKAGEELKHHKIPQAGIVVIEDDVELGANCAVERATIGITRIAQGSKIGDSVTIGHGTVIGRHNLLVPQVGIAGSSTTGDYVVIGGQVGVAGHLTIGTGAQLAAQSGVMTDVPAGEKYGGTPAVPLATARRAVVSLARLPDLIDEVRDLRKRVAELEGRKAE